MGLMHYTGLILTQIRGALAARNEGYGYGAAIEIDQLQQNAMWGAHMARLRFEGDPRTYRLILAPAEAPISIDGRPADLYFAEPLEIAE